MTRIHWMVSLFCLCFMNCGPCGRGIQLPQNDGGDSLLFPDSGHTDAGDGGRDEPCDSQSLGLNEPCSTTGQLPLCGRLVCNPSGEGIICLDPGANACGTCGELDTTTVGRVGEECGEFLCGRAVCNLEGNATICENDHTRNLCGGCMPFSDDVVIGATCSSCETGHTTCAANDESVVCYRGREPTTSCGGCNRCILAHAWMDDRHGGQYIREGTLALLEDVGDGKTQWIFDPLVVGPGVDGLPGSLVFLSSTANPRAGTSLPLAPQFASTMIGVPLDHTRTYTMPVPMDFEQVKYITIFEATVGNLVFVVSAGEIKEGAPEGYVDPSPPPSQ